MSTQIIVAIIGAAAVIIAAIIGRIAIHGRQERQHPADPQQLTYRQEVAIQLYDGTYLVIDANNKGTLVGGSEGKTAWGIFTIVKADPSLNNTTNTINVGDKVRFKAQGIGDWKYVSLRLQEEQQLAARSRNPNPDQIFTICATKQTRPGAFNYGSAFALKAPNNKMVTYHSSKDSGTKRLIAIYGHTHSKETFVFINPHEQPGH